MNQTISSDTIINFQGALIQHGTYNDRIYLMKIGDADPVNLSGSIIRLAKENNYSKIFARIPLPALKPFLEKGFVEEGRIPRFYHGREAAVFLGYYLDEKRKSESDAKELDKIIKLALKKHEAAKLLPPLESLFRLRSCRPTDADKMATIYQEVFASYPFPIHDPTFLLKTMEEDVDYFGVETDGELIALSSAEIDGEAKAAEMTDFATLPRWTGHSFGRHLLEYMEDIMKKKSIKTLYTIARAISAPMNITFAKSGYLFGGRMVNNTNISGSIESMNIWYKYVGERKVIS
ncbi:MAG: putative beta-lysine N-acetyltransferase [Candidatus Auribacterota bacterium]|nr:putative beta-lysine N-acetyltransferase [Candidatus Auribacterota bacterium]